MSYRLIDSNALAIKYPEVNDMPCIYADLDGLDGGHYDMRSPGVIQAENDKLRELVRESVCFERYGCYGCAHEDACDPEGIYDEGCARRQGIERSMRELGIEVERWR